ncbi:class I SAM-dependent methyltransferase [Frankia sp. CNm7]|uniref:Class I SAM-dependent methyltransferase n=1 Tax=Frankia nepalensis TaxID=1836974 RepID=A0A937RQ47_9ACTN|nr:class I SAM-dependent methyltransferase [Frankia nepalensis]MBL7494875.1 class I SAM-dependent methyltransferase [Frankia nepalensis]MBL7514419.1 class I SAM-dependent methyltransferase [Frankia nepalensis]MBL7519870.1 class I SAM-dependent methyltransferase [Frankia nepalensis]MBL7632869.1 class I SAM-dependent methyltransferase [Frankia nepalensis]
MLQRAEKFDVTFVATSDALLGSMSPQPREFLLRRALDEFVADVAALDAASAGMVSGAARPLIGEAVDVAAPSLDDDELIVSGQEVMQAWERPLMRALADAVARPGGSVLELGFGMAISAGYVQEAGPAQHTIVEANPAVAAAGRAWAEGRPGVEIVEGRWQEVLGGLGRYDGILFDTYPLTETEVDEYVMRDATFAEHFFPHAAAHLTDDGVFTYYSNEIDSVSRRHQRALLRHFRSFTVSVVDGLTPPPDCTYWWAPSMAVIVATAPRRHP